MRHIGPSGVSAFDVHAKFMRCAATEQAEFGSDLADCALFVGGIDCHGQGRRLADVSR